MLKDRQILVVILRRHSGAARDFAGGQCGRDRIADRRKRRGKNHNAPCDYRTDSRSNPASVQYLDKDLRKVNASEIVTFGLAHVPEGRQVFTRMSVVENLLMGAYFTQGSFTTIAKDLKKVYQHFPRLEERAETGCRYAFGRRTADAGDGQGNDVRAKADRYG